MEGLYRNTLAQRFKILVAQAKTGDLEAKWKAQAITTVLSYKHSIPNGLIFYNALNFPDNLTDADYAWIESLPDEIATASVIAGTPCNECCHRMLVMARQPRNEKHVALAYLLEARDEAESLEIQSDIFKAAVLLIDDVDTWQSAADGALMRVDELVTAESEQPTRDTE